MHRIIIASPNHPLVKRRKIPLAGLGNQTFLVREPGSGTRSAMERFFADRGIHVKAGMEMSSNETIKQAVMADLGISFLSLHTIGLELPTKQLTILTSRASTTPFSPTIDCRGNASR